MANVKFSEGDARRIAAGQPARLGDARAERGDAGGELFRGRQHGGAGGGVKRR